MLEAGKMNSFSLGQERVTSLLLFHEGVTLFRADDSHRAIVECFQEKNSFLLETRTGIGRKRNG